MKFIKKNAKYIGIVMLCVFCSSLTAIATSYIFEASDVRFDNTGTDLESVNVQDALDETFHHVTDYNEIKTTIGNSSLTTTSQNITGAINELNSEVATIDMGANIASLSTLESQLIAIGDAMGDYEVRNISFTVPSGGYGILKQAMYIGTIKRAGSGRYNILVQEFGVDGTMYTANYRNSVWTWSMANFLNKTEYIFTENTVVPAGGRITLTSSNISSIGGQYVNANIYNTTTFTGWSSLIITIVVNDSKGYISAFNATSNDITIPSGAKVQIWYASNNPTTYSN